MQINLIPAQRITVFRRSKQDSSDIVESLKTQLPPSRDRKRKREEIEERERSVGLYASLNVAQKKPERLTHAQRDTKLEACKYFIIGSCNKGDACSFSHDLSQFPCKFFHLHGSCPDDGRCRFSHQPIGEEELLRLQLREQRERSRMQQSAR
jgi:hypothetical protein